MKPRVGVVQFAATFPEGSEHPLGRGITYEIARRLTCIGGVEANAILLGKRGVDAPPGALSEGAGESPLSPEKTTGLSVLTLGARYESDYILLGRAHVADGLLLYYRVYEVASGRVIREGCATGLRTSIFRLLDELAREARAAIGLPPGETEEAEFNPVYERTNFEAFVEYCLAREEELPRNTMDHLERSLRLEPGFRMALVEYLSLCYQVDDLSSSLKLLDVYLALHPDDQEILIAAANLCLAFHRVEEGLVYARRALARRPRDAEPHVILARFLFAKELHREARAHLDAALCSCDTSPEGLYCLGRYFLDLGDFYRARDYFEKCLEVEPGFYVALRDLQCCYYELGDFRQGIDVCERLLEADPADAGSYYNLGLIYQRLGRVQLAKKYFEEAIRQDSGFYKAFFMVGEYHYSQKEFERALARFCEAHRLSPTGAEPLGRIGDCCYLLGREEEASRHYRRARREDPLFESPFQQLIEGRELCEAGNLEGARACFLKAAELDERLAEAWNELAGVLIQIGRAEEALNVVRRALEIEPEHPALLANLLTCCRRLPVGARLSGWARRLARQTRRRLADLRARGLTPSPRARRRHRRFLGSLTWYAFRE